jgi:hypothetical protein
MVIYINLIKIHYKLQNILTLVNVTFTINEENNFVTPIEII